MRDCSSFKRPFSITTNTQNGAVGEESLHTYTSTTAGYEEATISIWCSQVSKYFIVLITIHNIVIWLIN